MKSNFFYTMLSGLCLLMACGYPNASENKAYETKVEKELQSGFRNDTIFLEYYFGMSNSDFVGHTNKLIKEKKIRTTSGKSVVYDMQLDERESAETTFEPEFYNDKLCFLLLTVRKGMYNSPELTQLQIVQLFGEKYGFDFHQEPLGGGKMYSMVKGNLEINIFRDLNDAKISYVDRAALKEKEAEKLKNGSESKEKTKSDL